MTLYLSVVLVFGLSSMPFSVLLRRLFTTLLVASLLSTSSISPLPTICSKIFTTFTVSISRQMAKGKRASGKRALQLPSYLQGKSAANTKEANVKSALYIFEDGRLSLAPCAAVCNSRTKPPYLMSRLECSSLNRYTKSLIFYSASTRMKIAS